MSARTNVLLPLAIPTTKQLRRAVANIIRDIQRETEETDQETADALGVSVGTIRNARNEATNLDSLTIAKIGVVYGEEALAPYRALYANGNSAPAAPPISAMADALAALSRCDGPKSVLDSLPAAKIAQEALTAYINEIERKRLRAVS